MDAVEYFYRIKGHVYNNSYGQTASSSVTTTTANISAYRIQNNSATVQIQVSIDGGSNYRTVVQLQSLEASCKDTATSIKIKTSSSTAGYDLDYTTIP